LGVTNAGQSYDNSLLVMDMDVKNNKNMLKRMISGSNLSKSWSKGLENQKCVR
jgi:hypothetical protein